MKSVSVPLGAFSISSYLIDSFSTSTERTITLTPVCPPQLFPPRPAAGDALL
jgi:hypothetical protein